jgi:hypothetical protein
MRFFVIFLPLLWDLSGLGLAAASPSPPRPAYRQEQTHRFSVDVNAVALDVVVTDKKGRFVKGLKEADFVVLEDDAPQVLSFFTSGTTPVTVLLLLDSSASVRSHLKEVQKAANRFISKLQRDDQARIGFFHNDVIFGPKFTGDMDQHIAMINRMRPQRSTHLYDAVLASLRELSTVPDRKWRRRRQQGIQGRGPRSCPTCSRVDLRGWAHGVELR